ncbi:MAG: two-component sensor histidine kinase, partial [Streptosporangiaceae bacterium]
MQRRLLISTLVVAVVAVLLLGVPLAFDLSRLRTGQASQELRHEASYLATGLQDRYDSGLPADVAQVARSLSDRYVTVVERQPAGRVKEGVKPPAHKTITGKYATKNFTVTVEADNSFVSGQVTSGLLMIGWLALGALAVAVGLALLQARRLS